MKTKNLYVSALVSELRSVEGVDAICAAIGETDVFFAESAARIWLEQGRTNTKYYGAY